MQLTFMFTHNYNDKHLICVICIFVQQEVQINESQQGLQVDWHAVWQHGHHFQTHIS